MEERPPKIFISYSWTSPEHQERVLDIAKELRGSGVDVVLDKWDLREGQDAHAFMEQMVVSDEVKKVAILCDQQYVDRANERKGGVGTETQILTPELYAKTDQTKFVAVPLERDSSERPVVPAFYGSRVYIDLSDPSSYSENFEQLLRWIFDEPLHRKPEIGKRPSFVDSEEHITTGTALLSRKVIQNVKEVRSSAIGDIDEYLRVFRDGVSGFSTDPSDGADDFDEVVSDRIAEFQVFRDEFFEVLDCISRFMYHPRVGALLHQFFEALIPHLDAPEAISRYHKWDFDALRFIVHELFLGTLATSLTHERLDLAGSLLSERYYIHSGQHHCDSSMVSFSVFRKCMKSLEHRNQRLNLRRLSVRADLLINRTESGPVTREALIQADFVAWVRDAMESLLSNGRGAWWPETGVFSCNRHRPFELFAKAESERRLYDLLPLLGISSKDDLSKLIEASQDPNFGPRWEFHRLPVTDLINFEGLGTRQ